MDYDAKHPFHGLSTVHQRILRWEEIRKAATYWSDREAKARRDLFAECFPNPEEGTNTLDLGAGYALKAVHKMNFSLPSKDNSKDVRAAATEIGKITAKTDPTLADRLFTWKAEIKVGEYRKLEIGTPVYKALADVLTIKPAMPSLEITVPETEA